MLGTLGTTGRCLFEGVSCFTLGDDGVKNIEKKEMLKL